MRVEIDKELTDLLEEEEGAEVTIALRDNPAAEVLAAAEQAPSADGFVSAVERAQEAALGQQKELLRDLFGTGLLKATDAAESAFAAARPTRIPGVQQLWINNLIRLKNLSRSDLKRIIDHLGGRDEVEALLGARRVRLEHLLDEAAPVPVPLDAAPQGTPQPNLVALEAPLLWDEGITGRSVRVAVIDSGINYEHPDLRRRMWNDCPRRFPNHGFDFGRDSNDPMDQDGNGHGTACAGLIAGDGSSGAGGITGAAPGATLMALRVGDARKRVTDWSIWEAFEFAIRHGAHIISMSLSWKVSLGPNLVGWRKACEAVERAGILLVSSAGNLEREPSLLIGAPGNCPTVLACGATDASDLPAPDSGRGPVIWDIGPFRDRPASGSLPKPDLCAPGSGILSCNAELDPLHDSRLGGTSAATAQVAGCLALLAEARLRSGRQLVPAQLRQALEAKAEKFTGQGAVKENGSGAGKARVHQAFLFGIEQGWWERPAGPQESVSLAAATQGRSGRRVAVSSDKLSPALRRLLEAELPRQNSNVGLTISLRDGLAMREVEALLEALGDLGSFEHLPLLGLVEFLGPLEAVEEIAARSEVEWIDLVGRAELAAAFDA